MKKNEIYLEPDSFYHIYNRAVGDDNLFYSEANYVYFLKKYQEYISPVAETFVYCLIPNHFHFLIRVKDEKEIIKNINGISDSNASNVNTNLFVSKQFSNFFNGYSQAINKQQFRRGTLFSRPFKRKKVDSVEYLRNLVLYIHLNPVNHGLVQNVRDWKFSSYIPIITGSEPELKRYEVVNWFEDLDNLTKVHERFNMKELMDLEQD